MLTSERQNGPDRASLEQMSTASLEELLLRDFHTREHSEDGMGELYQAAQVLAGREPDDSAAADRAWERFQCRYLPFVNDASALSEDK